MELSKLKVYYGWTKLNKIRKQPALSVIFENEENYTERKMNSINKFQNTCFTRYQTVEEAADGKLSNRILTEFSFLIFDKNFKGNVEKVLELNYQADINNVAISQLEEIKKSLRLSIRQAYPDIQFIFEPSNDFSMATLVKPVQLSLF